MLGERGIVIHCIWGRGSAAISTTACQKKKKRVAQAFPSESPAYAITRLAGSWTESLQLQTMRSLMVQTWSQYLQFFFFKQAYENREVLILRLDSWRDRSRSISTPRRGEALAILVVTNQRSRPCEMFRNSVKYLWCGVVSTSPKPQAVGPPLVGCPRLLTQYIFSYTPYRVVVSPPSTWGHATLWWQEPTIS